jgi:hypothetical protein
MTARHASGRTAGRAARQAAGQGRDAAERHARRAADSEWVERLGRIGFLAYGVVYLLFAWLALQVALGHAQNEADSSGALQTIAGGPAGKILLWIVAVSLIALAGWQVAETILGKGAAEESDDTKRRAKKALYIAKAVVYALVGVSAARIGMGGSSSQKQKGSTLTGKLLELPAGQVLVVVLGAGIVVGAGVVVYRGWTKKFLKYLDMTGADQTVRATVTRTGQAGYTAQGISYGILGVLVIVGALTYDPEKAGGLDSALTTLAGQPFGEVLLIVVAVGLACYGVFCLFQSRYRRG